MSTFDITIASFLLSQPINVGLFFCCGAVACQARPSRPDCIEMLPDEQASEQQLAILRGMTGQRRLRLAEQLYWSARKMKTEGLRSQHPEWPKEQIDAEVRRIFLHARS